MAEFAIDTCLQVVHERLRELDTGEVASYIPELTKVDPDLFGLAVATLDGHVYGVGDDEHRFTIQSISKAFVYGLALDDHGVDYVKERVGVEPSGDAFNSIVMDEVNNRPLNPMVNAGAIACAAMITGDDLDHRRQRVLDTFARYAGRPLEVDWEVADSERRTGHRNRAIAYLELSTGMIDEPVDEHLDLYFEQCSILVTARDLAVMASTLANGGVNPITGERALRAEHVSKVLSVMATCGMYDWSGNWMFRVGMPAKSGVGGGIVAVLPGQVGIGTFSPRLDSHGNSCRGVQACESIATMFGLHLLDATARPSPVVTRRYTGSQVSSRRLRRSEQRLALDASGAAITVLEVQGDLFFATAEQLVRTVEDALEESLVIVIDARRLGTATAGAITLLAELRRTVNAAGVSLVLADAPDQLTKALTEPHIGWKPERIVDDVDLALEQAEDRYLAQTAGGVDSDDLTEIDLDRMDIIGELDPASRAVIAELLGTETYEPGEVILREGDTSDRVCYLAMGSASVSIGVGSATTRQRRLRTFGPGTMFGETAALEGGRRSASVIAEHRCTVRSLSVDAMQELAATHPEVHAHLLAALGRNLSEMLRRTVAELRALDG